MNDSIGVTIPTINPDGTLANDRSRFSTPEPLVILTPQGARLLKSVDLCAGCRHRTRHKNLMVCTRQDCDQWYTTEEIR